VEGCGGEVIIDRVVIPRVEKFKHLGLILEERGDIDDDINHHIKVGWQKLKNAFGVLYDKKILVRLKGKVYHIVVILALLYGAEYWPIKKKFQRLMITEMRMIQ